MKQAKTEAEAVCDFLGWWWCTSDGLTDGIAKKVIQCVPTPTTHFQDLKDLLEMLAGRLQ